MSVRQTALVAGATGSIGGGAATALAKRGAHVVVLGRNPDRSEARANSIRAELSKVGVEGSVIDTLTIDFSDMNSVRLAAVEALKRFPVINSLVLSSGALVQDGPNILPNGHELMFATDVMGPFLFTHLLLGRMQQSDALILQVVAPFYETINWEDLESIHNHKANTAHNRVKTMNRIVAAEWARRYPGEISSVAFNPSFIIDKYDPTLKERWPSGFLGAFWRVMTAVAAKPPEVAGEPIADLVLSQPDRQAINGALYRLDKRVTKPDKAMNDVESGQRLWDELVRITDPLTT